MVAIYQPPRAVVGRLEVGHILRAAERLTARLPSAVADLSSFLTFKSVSIAAVFPAKDSSCFSVLLWRCCGVGVPSGQDVFKEFFLVGVSGCSWERDSVTWLVVMSSTGGVDCITSFVGGSLSSIVNTNVVVRLTNLLYLVCSCSCCTLLLRFALLRFCACGGFFACVCPRPFLSRLRDEFHLGAFPSTKRSRYGTTQSMHRHRNLHHHYVRILLWHDGELYHNSVRGASYVIEKL